MMKKKALLLNLAACSSLALAAQSMTGASAYASFNDDKVTPEEAALAIINCADHAKLLKTQDLFTLAPITAAVQKISRRVTIKRYNFQAVAEGGYAGHLPGAWLFATVKVTSPPPGSADIPDRAEWTCEVVSPAFGSAPEPVPASSAEPTDAPSGTPNAEPAPAPSSMN